MPPRHRITIPGPVYDVTIFTAPPPSGIKNYGNAIALDNVRYTPPDPDPTFTFDLPASANRRVLTHRYGSDSYPSPQQTDDRKIRIEGTVTLNGLPAAGKTIYFRLMDPEDSAPYVKQAGDNKKDDNVDGTGAINGGTTASAVSDGAGRVSILLEVSDHVAGDNYQVEASTKSSFQCGPACPKSATYTAWKRIHLEKKRMFRQGAYVTTDIPANAGGTRISVSDLTQFQDYDRIRLIHAPSRFAPVGPPAPGGDSEREFYTEDHTIRVHKQPVTLPDGTVLPPHLELLPLPSGAPDSLQHSYGEDASLKGVEAVSDAAGVIGSLGPLVYDLDDALLAPAFEKAFVEYVDLPTTVAELPFQPRMMSAHLAHLPAKWADSSRWMGAGSARTSRENHRLLVTGSRLDKEPLGASELGQTPVASDLMHSWVWMGRIAAAVTEFNQPIFGQSGAAVMKETIVHEITHQWRVNVPGPAISSPGHCLDERYQNDGKYCLMHVSVNQPNHNSEFSDGFVDLHYRKVQGDDPDSEYLTIRRAAEPCPTR